MRLCRKSHFQSIFRLFGDPAPEPAGWQAHPLGQLDGRTPLAIKTLCLYIGDMALLNVRLTRVDEEAVKVLKAAHVELSSIIREALHKEAAKIRSRSESTSVALVREVFADHPEPPNPPLPTFNVHDRHEFAAAMEKHLDRKRRPAKR